VLELDVVQELVWDLASANASCSALPWVSWVPSESQDGLEGHRNGALGW